MVKRDSDSKGAICSWATINHPICTCPRISEGKSDSKGKEGVDIVLFGHVFRPKYKDCKMCGSKTTPGYRVVSEGWRDEFGATVSDIGRARGGVTISSNTDIGACSSR